MSDETKYHLEWVIEDAKIAIEHLDDIALDEGLDITPTKNAFLEAIRQVNILLKDRGEYE